MNGFGSKPLVEILREDGQLLAPTIASAACGEGIVCVPARNEARRLPALIAALDGQCGLGAEPLRLMLLLNNCGGVAPRTQDRRTTVSRPAKRRRTAVAPTPDG